MNLHKRILQIPIVSLAFLVFVPITAHLLFSSLGFNPTDDGFTLAYTRRIIEGQVPHRDFIIIRPFVSPLLHIPFVLWGGDFTFMASRFFVWFELACITWIWVSLLEKKLVRQSFGTIEKISIALIAFAASAHTFPAMAWHTIDGLFLMSIGIALCITDEPTNKLIGYVLMGMAYLCKQSFIFGAPFTLIVLGDWRNTKYWLAILAPGTLYGAFLLLSNALPDAIQQLSSQSDLVTIGLSAYFNTDVIMGVMAGYLSAYLFMRNKKISFPLGRGWREWLGILILSMIPAIIIAINFVSDRAILTSSFGLFGLVVGVTSFLLSGKNAMRTEQVAALLLVLITAWSTSLSIGYNYPVLASGQLVAALLALAYPLLQQKLEGQNGAYIYRVMIITSAVLVLVSFGIARMRFIYRDQAASALTERLDGVLPGGKGIRTNENTYYFLVDLQEAVRISEDFGDTYTIIPDCPGWWAASPQVNPLPIDWAQGTELNQPEFVDQVIRELASMRNTNAVIVQKVEADALAIGYAPLSDHYAIVEYVRHEFIRVYETSLFEIYR